MLRGLWKLTWLEIKIFLREPLGVVGTRRHSGAGVCRLGRMIGPRVGRAVA